MKSYETMYREALAHNADLLRRLDGANVRIRELQAAGGKRLNDYCRLEQHARDLLADNVALRKQLDARPVAESAQ